MTHPATALARAVVEALLEAGVREVVLSPGSRNAPLSFAAFDAAATGRLRLHTRIDERSAGFLAVGLTKVGARAAVLCTSGTAVANLHPAVLEAAHAGLPLVVLTADRPARLRGTDANQTTDQVGIFGPLVPTADLAADVLDGPGLPALVADGPTHWNVQLDEPLVPEDRWTPAGPLEVPAPAAREWVELSREVILDPDERRTVVVAGDGAGPAARVLAERAGWPLLAEPTSGARTGAHAIRTYRLLLGTELGAQVERVVVVGRPTLSRPVARLLAREDVEVLAVRHPGVWARPPWPARMLDEVPGVAGSAGSGAAGTRVSGSEGAVDGGWLAAWREADRALSAQVDALVQGGADLTPYAVAGAVSRALPAGGLLWVGASNPIRDLDLMTARYPVGQRRKVLANRGLAGIDGVVSSAIGAALGRPQGTRNLALVGDVTFLHDSNGLLLGPAEARPDLTIVVVNDDGGSIFATLEQGAPEHADPFEKVFGTPHGVDLASLCAATRTPHWRVDSLLELEHALASPNGGIEVVEAVVRRDTRRELDLALRALRP